MERGPSGCRAPAGWAAHVSPLSCGFLAREIGQRVSSLSARAVECCPGAPVGSLQMGHGTRDSLLLGSGYVGSDPQAPPEVALVGVLR